MAYGTTDRFTGGTASASAVYYGAASNAVDNNSTSVWATETYCPTDIWWKYDFGSGVSWKIGKVTIDCRLYEGNREVKDFTVYGSNNDSTWTSLYTGQCTNDANKQTFTFENTTAYRYIRITVTSSYRSPQYVSVEEFEAFETLVVHTIAAAVNGAATIGSAAKVEKRVASAVTSSATITSNSRVTKRVQVAIVPAGVVDSFVRVSRKIASGITASVTVTSDSKALKTIASAIIGSAVITSLARLNKRSYSDVIALATVSSTSRVQRIIQSAINAAAIVGSFIRVNLSFAGEVIANSVVTSAVKVQRNIQSAIQSNSTVSGRLVNTMRVVADVVANAQITSALTQISPAVSIASSVIANSIVSAGLRANYSLRSAIISVANVGALLTLLSGGATTGTFYLYNNTLITKTGADIGTYHILNNATDIRVGGTYIPILPFHYPYFESCTDGIVTLNLQIAA
jgi:hypothetical protein